MKSLLNSTFLLSSLLAASALSPWALTAHAQAPTTPAAAAATAPSGTAAEARTMFEKAVASLKADKSKALEMFNAGSDGFKDRDLYPFCANVSDGVFTAHPRLKGQKLSDLKEKSGRPFGQEIMAAAKEDTVSEVAYDYPKPGTETPVPKVAFVQKVGDQVLAVGYYK